MLPSFLTVSCLALPFPGFKVLVFSFFASTTFFSSHSLNHFRWKILINAYSVHHLNTEEKKKAPKRLTCLDPH